MVFTAIAKLHMLKQCGENERRKAEKELDGHYTARFEECQHGLGSSTTAHCHCQQRRLALACSPVSLT